MLWNGFLSPWLHSTLLCHLFSSLKFRCISKSFYFKFRVEERLTSDINNNIPPEEAWNNHMIELINATRAHCFNFVLENFYNIIKGVDDLNLQSILMKLCHLFALWNMLQLATQFLEFGFLSTIHTRMLRSQVVPQKRVRDLWNFKSSEFLGKKWNCRWYLSVVKFVKMLCLSLMHLIILIGFSNRH